MQHYQTHVGLVLNITPTYYIPYERRRNLGQGSASQRIILCTLAALALQDFQLDARVSSFLFLHSTADAG
jgi:hypothetical protein